MCEPLPKSTSIYVALLDEGTDVWAPVRAEWLGGDRYRILQQPYDPDDARWQFEPGDVVICEWATLSGERSLVAVRNLEDA